MEYARAGKALLVRPARALGLTHRCSQIARLNTHAEYSWFASAVKSARATNKKFPRVTPHDLRHTAASLAVSAGANVKLVQRMLGHKSAAVTLDIYSDLFEQDIDKVAADLSAARAVALTLAA